MPRNTTPISTEEYWELRAKAAEAALTAERPIELGRLRTYMATLIRVVGLVDHFAEVVRGSSELMAEVVKEEADGAIARLVDQYSLPESPHGYVVDLTGGPGASVLREKGEG